MEILDIYVNMLGYLLTVIDIHCCREISQFSMFSEPYMNDILIDNYKPETLSVFMLADGVYITLPLNLLKVEVINHI